MSKLKTPLNPHTRPHQCNLTVQGHLEFPICNIFKIVYFYGLNTSALLKFSSFSNSLLNNLSKIQHLFLAYFLLWCSSSLCSRPSTLRHVQDTTPLTTLISSLSFPLTSTFMQIALSSSSHYLTWKKRKQA